MKKNKIPLLSLKSATAVYTSRRGIFKSPAKITAAAGITLDIHPGEVLAVVGESGCGKSTLGNMIIGMLKPASGSVLFEGRDIHCMDRSEFEKFRSSVQLVQQDSYAALNPVRTIMQSLCGPVIHKKIAKNHAEALRMVHVALDMVGIEKEALEKYPHELSGGQRQRLLMARAILMKPRLIVADEPVSMIDVSLRISILNLMSELNRTLGIAFVYITHDFGTARYIARNGNIMIMYLAKAVEYGNVQSVLEHPSHPYLQALLSAVPVPDPLVAKKRRELPLKSVDMTSAAAPPSGCRFHPRCPHATELCKWEEPELLPHEGGLCACHYANKIPKWNLREFARL